MPVFCATTAVTMASASEGLQAGYLEASCCTHASDLIEKTINSGKYSSTVLPVVAVLPCLQHCFCAVLPKGN